MALPSFAVTSDSELEAAARDKTSYDDNADELPGAHDSGQMEGLIEDAKRVLYMKTGSDKWYSDVAYGQALVALTAMKMKEAVENVNIERYGIADETLSFHNADPEDSQQIQSWSSEVNEGLDESGIDFDKSQSLTLSNTSSYVG
jgi:hypothetical protein